MKQIIHWEAGRNTYSQVENGYGGNVFLGDFQLRGGALREDGGTSMEKSQ